MAKSKMEMKAEGMTGEGIVRSIETALSGIHGVQYAHVNLGAGKIYVEFDDAVASVAELVGTVKRLGIDARQL